MKALAAWWEEHGKTIPAKPNPRGRKPNSGAAGV
jgi:hypothetical protein